MENFLFNTLNDSDIEKIKTLDKTKQICLTVVCCQCNNPYNVIVYPQDLVEFVTSTERSIMQIFPYLDANDRELLISHMCGRCYDSIFPEEDD